MISDASMEDHQQQQQQQVALVHLDATPIADAPPAPAAPLAPAPVPALPAQPPVVVPASVTAPAPAPAPPAAAAAAATPKAPRTYVPIDPAIRARAIELVVNQNWKVTDTARVLGVKQSMLYKCIERVKRDLKLGRGRGLHLLPARAATAAAAPATAREQPPPPAPTLTEEQKARLREWAEADRTLTANALAAKARAELGIAVTLPTVRRTIQNVESQQQQLTDEQKARVREWAEDDATLTSALLADKVRAEFGISVAVATVARALRGLHFSLDRVAPLPAPVESWNQESAVQQRYEYVMEYLRLLPKRHKFVFVDEVAFSYSLLARYNTSALTSSPSSLLLSPADPKIEFTPLTSVRTQPFSVATALMDSRLVMYNVKCGEFMSSPFETLLVQVTAALREAGVDDAVIVMSAAYKAQASVEQTIARQELVSRLGHSLLFLPADSPFLNPSEAFFAEWTQLVRSGPPPATERDLLKLIETRADASLTPADCAKFFRSTEAFIHASVLKERVTMQ